MAYGMTTKFTDTKGEEFVFLGTSISFSEKALIELEQEHDKLCAKYVEELLSDGYFEEEWTDYYAETDDDDEDCQGYDEHVDDEKIDECNKENYDNNNNEYVLSQTNVPLFSVTSDILNVNVNTFHQNNSSPNQLALYEKQLHLQCVSTEKQYFYINVNVNGIYMQMIKIIN